MARVWLASYPKCGNTWMRVLLANLGREQAGEAGMLAMQGGIASGRHRMDEAVLFSTGLLTHDEADRLRPAVYRHYADQDEDEAPLQLAGTRFMKTHDAWTLTDRGEPLLGGPGAARAAVLIVRDPRDVAASYANHSDRTIDEIIAHMADPDGMLADATDRLPLQLRQRLLGWSGFYRSWLDQTEIPVHLLRYEDLHADTAAALAQVLAALELGAEERAIALAVEQSRFEVLREREARFGFREAPRHMSAGRFFRSGRAGGWREELTELQSARIVADHGEMMRRCGYLDRP